ncbi:non-specific serine/threonine protein kinase [Malassezia psittaci]|uniref:non-specific serine/threonine protein kinase n=1 Tax=Malassezia psittaci TaxID=1821823 RepID=A0AAF0F817_9BASI|nr:non-specific serine/threonine protein kinase [Malassezia psittaci]
MSFLGSNTRRVNVYGRKGGTRIVSRNVENDSDVPPPSPPKSTGWGFFSAADLRTFVNSPRKALAQLSPKKKSSTDLVDYSNVPKENETKTTETNDKQPAPRTPLASRENGVNSLDPVSAPITAMSRLNLDDKSGSLSGILEAAGQKTICPFDDCIEMLVGDGEIVKVAEASYSEVYRITRRSLGNKANPAVTVVKVIPLEGEVIVKGPAQSSLASVEREIRMTSVLSSQAKEYAQFVQLQESHIVQGRYPPTLLRAWDRFKENDSRSENPRPDQLRATQRYALLCMNDAGTEWEYTTIGTWVERAALFWQVSYAISQAEMDCSFEHRDLHLGNILVARTPPRRTTRSVSGQSSETTAGSLPNYLWQRYGPRAAYIRATIIDYSLSRMTIDGKIHAYDFNDPALFQGEGDSQYDVYRTMRALTVNQWSDFHPSTNVLWLHFIVNRILTSEHPPESSQKEEQEAYASLLLAEQLADDAVRQLRASAPQRSVSTRSKRRSIQHSPDAWKTRHELLRSPIYSAGDLVKAVCHELTTDYSSLND